MQTLKLAAVLIPFALLTQSIRAQAPKFTKDSLIIIEKSPQKGFHNAYILFIPKGTPKTKRTYLLVEPNNTGKVSDSIEVHRSAAITLASVSSVGNNVSTELRIPLLVPIFPRPASKELVYSHALDRDVMLETAPELKRLDLQLIAMIKDARQQLEKVGLPMHDKVFMNGFSASGTFTNRFTVMHPNIVRAAAMGGLNGELILPLKSYQGKKFDYPLGINDLQKITDIQFDAAKYKTIPQLIYMGALDNNDAVQFDDAYSAKERKQINTMLGDSVQNRWDHVQKIYLDEKTNARFKTYEDVGHYTTSKVNLDVILFFNEFLKD